MRAMRLRGLLDMLPVPSDGLSFLGGEQSVLCFEEIDMIDHLAVPRLGGSIREALCGEEPGVGGSDSAFPS